MPKRIPRELFQLLKMLRKEGLIDDAFISPGSMSLDSSALTRCGSYRGTKGGWKTLAHYIIRTPFPRKN